MKPTLWRSLGAGVLALAALGLVRAGCRAVPEEQELVREDPDAGPDATAEARRAERLSRLRQVIFWACDQRAALATDLVAGRLTLVEAAAGFRAVQQIKEQYARAVPLYFLGKTEEERLCRQVLAYAVEQRRDEPDQAAVVERLRQELQERLDRDGAVPLPAPPRLDPPPLLIFLRHEQATVARPCAAGGGARSHPTTASRTACLA
jgi:hypothetical protein